MYKTCACLPACFLPALQYPPRIGGHWSSGWPRMELSAKALPGFEAGLQLLLFRTDVSKLKVHSCWHCRWGKANCLAAKGDMLGTALRPTQLDAPSSKLHPWKKPHTPGAGRSPQEALLSLPAADWTDEEQARRNAFLTGRSANLGAVKPGARSIMLQASTAVAAAAAFVSRRELLLSWLGGAGLSLRTAAQRTPDPAACSVPLLWCCSSRTTTASRWLASPGTTASSRWWSRCSSRWGRLWGLGRLWQLDGLLQQLCRLL